MHDNIHQERMLVLENQIIYKITIHRLFPAQQYGLF
jgi:hypothetical protein